MAPKLYGTLVCPPFRSVLLTEAALGIKLEHVEVNSTLEDNLKSEFVKMNPQHTIPYLMDDDGTTVSDSHAIMAYLVGKYGKDDKLYPKDHTRRADIDHKLYFDASCIFSLVRRIALDLKLNKAKAADETCKNLAEENCNFLNTFLEEKKWVSGDSLTIADFSLLTSVTALNILVPINPKFINVLNWIKRAEALPYYNINREGLVLVQEFIKFLTSQ